MENLKDFLCGKFPSFVLKNVFYNRWYKKWSIIEGYTNINVFSNDIGSILRH